MFKKRTAAFLAIAMMAVFICTSVMGVHVDAAENAEKISGKINGVDDLPGHKIGVQLGTTGDIYASDYESDGVTVVERFNKGNDAIMALVQNKIDCVIIDEQPAKEFVKANAGLRILEEEFVNEDYAIGVAKDKPQLLKELNGALEELKNEGTLKQIIDSYINNADGSIDKYEKKDVNRDGKLVMATNAAFPPYESKGGDGEIIGIDVDIANAIADKLGKELVIDDIEFNSIISAVDSGKANFAMAGMTVTEDRLKNINFTDSYANSKQVIIVNDGTKGSVESASQKQTFKEKFKSDFIEDSRWKNITTGLKNTLIITLFAAILGIVIGFLIAMVRSTYDRTRKLKILNFICRVYLTIIRGTPTVVQLLIIYYVVFASVNVNKVLVAILAFGINSGAYVAEIVRSGIMATPQGQMEAGRSLGLTYGQTMKSIIMPQAFKNVLPALGNEFIVLLKETSVSGYIGMTDLTRGGDIIRSITYDAMLPLIGVALCYLVMVMILSALVNRLERSLRKNER